MILLAYPLISYFLPEAAEPTTNVTGLLKALTASNIIYSNYCWSVSRDSNRFNNRVLYSRIKKTRTKYSSSITNRCSYKHHCRFSAWNEIYCFTGYLYCDCNCSIIITLPVYTVLQLLPWVCFQQPVSS